ncbi:hypothetical protein D8674_026648 [Pyrus ussuriensis x Pyrus communis]|uniref:Uncharacterized protein n=1 Tax=Pyrus ussuriensis x Pyrus communis TaxID=2448454 RepID=A0A5N5IM36_9ROSA|nr:hypothetical protein D8674_026648 [Pyrus ussuriensis x Pyrus communis]
MKVNSRVSSQAVSHFSSVGIVGRLAKKGKQSAELTMCKEEDSNYEVTLVFIDNGSSINVVFFLDFDQLGVNRDLLNGNLEPLIPFGDNIIHPFKEMDLTLSIGLHLRRMSLTTGFTIVDCFSSNNVILGQPFFTEMDMTINQKMLVMKFLTSAGIRMVRIDQCQQWHVMLQQ